MTGPDIRPPALIAGVLLLIGVIFLAFTSVPAPVAPTWPLASTWSHFFVRVRAGHRTWTATCRCL